MSSSRFAIAVLVWVLAPSGLAVARAQAPSPVTAKGALEPGATISLSVKDADLVEVIRSLARISGRNLVLHPGIVGTVTAELHDVRWDRALAVILKTHGLAMEIDGRVIAVAPPARLLNLGGVASVRPAGAAVPRLPRSSE